MTKPRKPREIKLYDAKVLCSKRFVTFTFYRWDMSLTASDGRRLAAWLLRAADFLEAKEGR